MPAGYVRKKCVDCKRTTQGRKAKLEWCDCGGELIAIPGLTPVAVRRRG